MISITKQEVPAVLNQPDDDVILSVDHVSKRFCRDLKRSLLYGIQDITADLIGIREASEQLRPQEFWALNDVSFQLRRGEALGLVGKNGSGKSTLLRIIAGLIKPDSGSVKIKGRVAPLIALGAGFNPILTGRENIYTNMSILGLSKLEIEERFDAVVEFSEIGDAIDAPVQSYSSGMAARLGFASAIHTQPDILLLDEVLAVGDIQFRAKCYRKLAELQRLGVAFILVSHNPQSILTICKQAVYLLKGKRIMQDEACTVMDRYEHDLFVGKIAKSSGFMDLSGSLDISNRKLSFVSLFFRDETGQLLHPLESGKPAYFCIKLKAYEPVANVSLTFTIKEQQGEGEPVLRNNSQEEGMSWNLSTGEHELQVYLPYVGFKPGAYTMKLNISRDRFYMFDVVEAFNFSVEGKGMSQCKFYQPKQWNLVSKIDA